MVDKSNLAGHAPHYAVNAAGGMAGYGGPDTMSAAQSHTSTSTSGTPGAPHGRNTLTLTPATAAILEGLDDDDSDMDEGSTSRASEKRSGRRKIKIEYIEDKSRRHITFSKRKAGIMKKVLVLDCNAHG